MKILGPTLTLSTQIRVLITFISLPSFQTGHSALQRAAAEGHVEVVKHLVGRGAAVDHQDEVVSSTEQRKKTVLYRAGL